MGLLFEDHARILFIGDSIGDYGRGRPRGDAPDSWGDSYIAQIANMLCAAYPKKNLRICNMCTDGHRSRDLAERWRTDVLDWKPDWVCMMIGINDVWRRYDSPFDPSLAIGLEEYEKTLDDLISVTLKQVKGMILMTPYFMVQDRHDPMRLDMIAYGEAVKRIGEKFGLTVIDTQAMWDSFFQSSGLHPHALCWDCIHPNRIGAALLAKTFLKAVGYEW